MANVIPIGRAIPAKPAVVPMIPPERRGKLLYKLLGGMLALSILPLLICGYLSIRVSKDYIENESRGVKKGIAQKVAGNVLSYLDNVRNILDVVQKSNDFMKMTPHKQSEVLLNVMTSYPIFMRIEVIDLNRKRISAAEMLGENDPTLQHKIKPDEVLRAILNPQLRLYIGPVYRSKDNYPVVSIAVPIERVSGKPEGALVAVVNLVDLSSLVKELLIGKRGYVYIVDMRQHQLVAHPDFADPVKAMDLLNAAKPMEVTVALLTPDQQDMGAIEFTDEKGNKFLDIYSNVPRGRGNPNLTWRVFVQQPTEEAYQSSSQMRSKILGLLIFVAVLTLGLAFLLSSAFVKRVLTLQGAMELVGEGRFDVPQVPSSNDEFGALTEKFLWMAHSLKDKTLRLLSAQMELQRWNTQLEQRVNERTRALQEAQEQLIAQEKLAVLGQMASVVGHELRNPLAVMNNSVYFLKTKLASAAGGELDPKLDKHLKILESEIIKSNAIIRDVLDFSRNRALVAAAHNVDELMEKAMERITLPQGVTLQKRLRLNDIEAMVDEDEIRQVLVNLMENACQAMTSGGTLTVGTKAQNDMVQIDIADTGCGIPQEHLNKIFAPFFTTKSRGTGLGLAVVKKVVERHHGTIEIHSKLGEGTVFHIRLPISQPKAEGQTGTAA